MNIVLGRKYRDLTTGIEGIAVMKTEYINGCVRFGLQRPVNEDGTVPDLHHVDWQELDHLSYGIERHLANIAAPASAGGPPTRGGAEPRQR